MDGTKSSNASYAGFQIILEKKSFLMDIEYKAL